MNDLLLNASIFLGGSATASLCRWRVVVNRDMDIAGLSRDIVASDAARDEAESALAEANYCTLMADEQRRVEQRRADSLSGQVADLTDEIIPLRAARARHNLSKKQRAAAKASGERV